MKTPITDATYSDAAKLNPSSALMKLGITARKLESDRSALMSALDELIRFSNESDGFQYGTLSASFVRTFAKDALSAARANFPEQP